MGLRLENLTYKVNNNVLLENTNLSIDKDKLTVLFGPNGSGKTILLKLMSGILKNYTGNIYINNKNIKEYKIKELSKIIGYVPPNSYSVFNYAVIDYVLMGKVAGENTFYIPTKKDFKKAENILKVLGIHNLLGKNYNNLSTGEKQLVLIARSLIKDLQIIFLDEPVSNLDFYNQHKLFNIIKDLQKNNVFVIVSLHDPNLALKYSENMILMEKSKIYDLVSMDNEKGIGKFERYLKKIYAKNIHIIKHDSSYFIDM